MPSNPPFRTKRATYFGRNKWMTLLGVTPWILCVIGLLTSLFNGRSPWFSAARQAVFGCAAAAITYGVGSLLGVSLS